RASCARPRTRAWTGSGRPGADRTRSPPPSLAFLGLLVHLRLDVGERLLRGGDALLGVRGRPLGFRLECLHRHLERPGRPAIEVEELTGHLEPAPLLGELAER